MFLLRPAKLDDLAQLLQLAEVMAPGITTFPPDESVIKEKIQKSAMAFAMDIADVDSPRDFLLVCEDQSNHRVIGTTGIYSHIGHDSDFYSLERTSEKQETRINGQSLTVDSISLHLTTEFNGATEVGTLLLHPDYAGQGLGKFLAKSRYLFIRLFEQLFKEPVIAELRGVTEEGDISPFWEAIGRHFFGNMEFAQADFLSATTDKQFIADLYPKYPIYEHMLPETAKRCINMANRKGQAALNMLYKEGFKDKGYIDIFDAGATVVAQFSDLETYRKIKALNYHISTTADNTQRAMLAVENIADFKILLTTEYLVSENTLGISQTVNDILAPVDHSRIWYGVIT